MIIAQDWDKSRLADYLLFDSWIAKKALYVLIGMDYFQGLRLGSGTLDKEKFKMSSSPLSILKWNDQNSVQQRESYKAFAEDWEKLADLWDSRGEGASVSYSPAYFIEWALSKRFRPDWLDWAIERGLYTPKQEAAQPAQIATAPTYSTSWLAIQQAAINQFFNPRRNPDAKKDEVTDWIKEQALAAGLPDSQNVASTIFTIIKPENHDPKKKRVEPQ